MEERERPPLVGCLLPIGFVLFLFYGMPALVHVLPHSIIESGNAVGNGIDSVGHLIDLVATPVEDVFFKILRWTGVATPAILFLWCAWRLQPAITANANLPPWKPSNNDAGEAAMRVIGPAFGLWAMLMLWSLFAFPDHCGLNAWELPIIIASLIVVIGVLVLIAYFITGGRVTGSSTEKSDDDGYEDETLPDETMGGRVFAFFSQAPRAITLAFALATIAELNQQVRFQYHRHHSNGVTVSTVFDRLTHKKDIIYSDECDSN